MTKTGISTEFNPFPAFLEDEADVVARGLLGCYLIRAIDDIKVMVKIVETESSDQFDAASHSYLGQTPRTEVMFGPAGRLYVYFTYGMHYCCNVVVGKEGVGSAVLIRAAEPVDSHDYIAKKRGKTGVSMTNGPAKLCQALSIDKRLNGHDLRSGSVKLISAKTVNPDDIVTTTRIGISKARDTLRRFYIKDNPYVSVY